MLVEGSRIRLKGAFIGPDSPGRAYHRPVTRSLRFHRCIKMNKCRNTFFRDCSWRREKWPYADFWEEQSCTGDMENQGIQQIRHVDNLRIMVWYIFEYGSELEIAHGREWDKARTRHREKPTAEPTS
jgi:hypothetical protein